VSIENELKLLQNMSQYKMDISVDGEAYPLQHQQKLIIFSIFQEALQNILKHTKASFIAVRFVYRPGNFILQISDNGQGFHLPSSADTNHPAAGIGIRNIRHRAMLISADVNIESSPGKGTTVTINLPLQPNIA